MPKSAAVIAFPASTRARNRIRRGLQSEAFDVAIKNGFMHVNDQERALLELLRWTSFAGRDAVTAFAKAMRETQPWQDRNAK